MPLRNPVHLTIEGLSFSITKWTIVAECRLDTECQSLNVESFPLTGPDAMTPWGFSLSQSQRLLTVWVGLAERCTAFWLFPQNGCTFATLEELQRDEDRKRKIGKDRMCPTLILGMRFKGTIFSALFQWFGCCHFSRGHLASPGMPLTPAFVSLPQVFFGSWSAPFFLPLIGGRSCLHSLSSSDSAERAEEGRRSLSLLSQWV